MKTNETLFNALQENKQLTELDKIILYLSNHNRGNEKEEDLKEKYNDFRKNNNKTVNKITL